MKNVFTLILILYCISCSNSLDIKQDYNFNLTTMPVPSKIQNNETIEIRCRIVREGKFEGTRFFIRYFQSDGKGSLKLQNTKLLPNDLYKLNDEVFRLYYTSESSEQQVFDIYIEDNFGQVIEKKFSFTSSSNQ